VSASDRGRRYLHAVTPRREVTERDLSASEVDEVVTAWVDLTDDVVRVLVHGDLARAFELADAGRQQLATRYGGVALLVGPVTAAATLARHLLEHAEGIVGIGGALEALDPPLDQRRMGWAVALAHGIAADAGGLEGAAPEATVLLMNEAGTDAPAIASVVWWAFCRVGADEGVGATWCTDAEEVTEEDDVDQAVAAIGAAACLVGLVGTGQERLARALATSIASDIVLPEGVAACLALLDLDREPDRATVRRVCHEATERPVDDGLSVEAGTEELLERASRAARRLGGGEGAGLAALERLERWLVTRGE
jgi:hypothetical protein